MIRRPPRSTRTDTLFPTRRSSDLKGMEFPLWWSSAQLQPGGTVQDGMVTSGTYGNVKPVIRNDRSEEHTSELQSLMRISYAVFCLKKKKTTKKIQHHTKK